MFFEYDLTVPASTAKASPATLEAPLAPGTVVQVGIQFPPGCRGMVEASIWREEHQVWPVNLDESIKGDGVVVQWPEDYDLDDDPFTFILKAWSPDTAFPHTLTFRFALLPLGLKEAAQEQLSLLQRIKRALIGAS